MYIHVYSCITLKYSTDHRASPMTRNCWDSIPAEIGSFGSSSCDAGPIFAAKIVKAVEFAALHRFFQSLLIENCGNCQSCQHRIKMDYGYILIKMIENGYDVFQNASKGWALIKTVKSRSCAAISNLSQFSVAQKLWGTELSQSLKGSSISGGW